MRTDDDHSAHRRTSGFAWICVEHSGSWERGVCDVMECSLKHPQTQIWLAVILSQVELFRWRIRSVGTPADFSMSSPVEQATTMSSSTQED